MKISQIILFSLLLINLGIDMARHDQEKKGKHNFFITLFSAIILFFLYVNAFSND